jgi:glycosyltransferase involved in cell wall biosynthesis
MDISIIIPTYNSERTVGRCLESLLEQSVLPGEIVIPDGNSHDNTEKICNSFDTPLIRFIPASWNISTGSARNLGASLASHGYLVFLDSDCVAHGDLIKNYIREFTDHECVAGNVLVANPGKIANRIYLGEKILLQNHVQGDFVTGFFFWVMNFGIRKDTFISFPDSTYSEDMVFISNLFRAGRPVKFCKEAVVSHRYPETIPDFFQKKVNCAKGFIKQNEMIDFIHRKSYFGIIRDLMSWDTATLKDAIENRKICFHPRDGFSIDGTPEPGYALENALCLSAAVAVLEDKGLKLPYTYDELLQRYFIQ